MTIDEDVAQEIRRRMRERDAGFKETVNDLLRRGLRARDEEVAGPLPTFRSGPQPGVDLDRALALAGALEDEQIVRKLDRGA